MVAVTLQDGNDWADHEALYNYGFSTYPAHKAAILGKTLYRAPVKDGLRDTVSLAAAESFSWPLAEGEQLEMRFIEMMPMYDGGDFDRAAFIPGTTVLEKLPEAVPTAWDGGVAKLYRLPGAQGNIGLISPVSAHFCGECNRIRLTADGKIKPCLHSAQEYPLKGLDFAGMRAQAGDGALGGKALGACRRIAMSFCVRINHLYTT